MRVCVDIQSALSPCAGVGRYTHQLVRALARTCSASDELLAFCFDVRRRLDEHDLPGVHIRACRWVPGRVVQHAWKRTGWPPFDLLAGSADVYHFPNFIRPPLRPGARSVVTIHDLSFLRYPETTEERNLAYLTRHIGPTVATVDAILTDSHSIAAEVRERWPDAADRVVAVPLGVPEGFQRAPAQAVEALRRRHGLHRDYLLSVGTIEPRKNYPFLVDVFERLEDLDADLVIAGRLGWKWQPIFHRIESSRRRDRIRHLVLGNDTELAALYTGARLFVWTTLYEGFGFPPLEAMACHVPVIVSAGGSLPEVCGEGATVVHGYDVEQWAEAIRRMWWDESARAESVRRGRLNLNRFSWERTARMTWDVYRTVYVGGCPRDVEKDPNS